MSEEADSALRTVTRGAGVVLFGTVLQLGIAFLAKVLMARFLTLDEYGFVSLGIIAINFGATVSLLGLDTGLARFLPRYETETEKRAMVYFSYAIALAVSVLVGAGLYLSAETLSVLVFDDPRLEPVLRVMALGVPFWTALDLGVGVTRGASDALPRVLAKNVLLPLGRFTLVAIAVVLGAGAIGMAGAYVGAYMVASVLMLYLVFRRFRPTRPGGGGQARDLLEFSVPLTFSDLSSLLYRNVDLVLLGVIVGSGQVAIYNVAYPLARLLLAGMGAFGFLFVPVVSSLHAEDNLDEARRVYQIVTKWLVVLLSPPFAIMVLFPEMSITVLFGAKYVDGALTLVVLAVGFYVSNLTGLTLGTLTSVGRSRTVMVADATAMAFNVGLNLLLIPRYSYLGAGIATGVTFLYRDLFGAIVLYRETGIHPFTSALVKPAIFTALSVTVIYVPVRLFLRVTLVRLVVLFGLFLGVYALAMLRLGGIEPEDVMMFNAVEEETGIDLSPVRRVLRRLLPS